MVRYTNKKRSSFIRNHPKLASAVAVGLVGGLFVSYENAVHPHHEAPAPVTSPDTRPSRPVSFGCDHMTLAKQNGGWLVAIVTKGPTPQGNLHMEFSASYTGHTPDIHDRVVAGLSTLIPLAHPGDLLIGVEGGVVDPAGQLHHCTLPVSAPNKQ